jgi:hypothetical protein
VAEENARRTWLLAPFDIEPHAAPGATAHGAPAPCLLGELGFEPSNLAELAIPTGMSGASKLFEDFCRARPAMTWRATFPH